MQKNLENHCLHWKEAPFCLEHEYYHSDNMRSDYVEFLAFYRFNTTIILHHHLINLRYEKNSAFNASPPQCNFNAAKYRPYRFATTLIFNGGMLHL